VLQSCVACCQCGQGMEGVTCAGFPGRQTRSTPACSVLDGFRIVPCCVPGYLLHPAAHPVALGTHSHLRPMPCYRLDSLTNCVRSSHCAANWVREVARQYLPMAEWMVPPVQSSVRTDRNILWGLRARRAHHWVSFWLRELCEFWGFRSNCGRQTCGRPICGWQIGG
jgi:hypothetical protein